MLVANQYQRGKHVNSNNVVKPNKTRSIQPLNETCYFYWHFKEGGIKTCFSKLKYVEISCISNRYWKSIWLNVTGIS